MSDKYDVVIDGRDIGILVLRDLKHKFFLIATDEARAERRFKDYSVEVSYEYIFNGIKERYYLDENRYIHIII